MNRIILTAAISALAFCAQADAQERRYSFGYSNTQGGSDREFHASYYERGYDRHSFRYHRASCERRGGGLGLGLSLGGAPLLSASLGRGWTECDRGQFSYAHGHAFEYGEASYWENPRSGRRGVVRPERHYERGGRECFSGEAETFDRRGDYQRFSFESCRDGSGSWSFERSW